MGTKSTSILNKTSSSHYDIIIFTETWLREIHHTSEFFSDNFDVFRCDRSSIISNAMRGGGVLIATNTHNIKCYEVELPNKGKIESICVKMKVQLRELFIYAFYIPPDSHSNIYEAHIEAIDAIKMANDDILVVVGDANLPNICWEKDRKTINTYVPMNMRTQQAQLFLNQMICMNLMQLNGLKNVADNILDLCFVNEPSLSVFRQSVRPLSYPVDIHHNHFELDLRVNYVKINNQQTAQQYFAYYLADFVEIINKINEIDWDSVLNSDDIDDNLDIYYEKIAEIINMLVPKKNRVAKKKAHAWENDRELKNLKNRRRKSIKRLRRCNSQENVDDFNKRCQDYDELYAELYYNYIGRIQDSFNSDPKKFWQYVAKKKSYNLPNVMQWEGNTANNDGEIADLFADFFNSVFDPIDDNFDPEPIFRTCLIDDNDTLITIDDISTVLKSLDVAKGSGPDLISPLVYKKCAESLAKPLLMLLSKSIVDGKFPSKLKKAFIKPIFKNGDKKDIVNYRSVTLAPTTSKIFESIILNKLKNKIYSKINVEQHGFVRNKSTVSNLMTLVTDVNENFVSRSPTHIIFTDFEKAFDKTHLPTLLKKIVFYGLDEKIVRWIWSFLTKRELHSDCECCSII